jgi:hypothetical protein
MLWTAPRARRRRLRRNAAAFRFSWVFVSLGILVHPAWLSIGMVVGSVETVERFIREIKTGKPRTAGGGGIAVIKVEGAKWPTGREFLRQATGRAIAIAIPSVGSCRRTFLGIGCS